MIWENAYIRLWYFYSIILFYSHSSIFQTLFLRGFYIFVCLLLVQLWQGHIILNLIVEIILLEIESAFSVPRTDEKQCLVNLNLTYTLQLINGNSSDCQKFLRYFNGTATVDMSETTVASFWANWASLSHINLILYLKDLKPSVSQH